MGFFLVYVTAGPDLKISARRGNKERLKRKKRRKKLQTYKNCINLLQADNLDT